MNLPRLSAWLLGVLCTFAGTSCEKSTTEPEVDVVQVSYTQTQCADPWGFVGPNQQLITVATTYLVQKGITLVGPKTAQAGPQAACAACTCGTGVVLVGSVSAKDLAAIQALGFKKI